MFFIQLRDIFTNNITEPEEAFVAGAFITNGPLGDNVLVANVTYISDGACILLLIVDCCLFCVLLVGCCWIDNNRYSSL